MEKEKVCEVLTDAKEQLKQVYKMVYELQYSFVNDCNPFDNDNANNRVLELKQVLRFEVFNTLSKLSLSIEEILSEIEKQ